MKLACGCYVAADGHVIAMCAECNGNAEKSCIEIEKMERDGAHKSPAMLAAWRRRKAREAQKIQLLTRSP